MICLKSNPFYWQIEICYSAPFNINHASHSARYTSLFSDTSSWAHTARVARKSGLEIEVSDTGGPKQ